MSINTDRIERWIASYHTWSIKQLLKLVGFFAQPLNRSRGHDMLPGFHLVESVEHDEHNALQTLPNVLPRPVTHWEAWLYFRARANHRKIQLITFALPVIAAGIFGPHGEGPGIAESFYIEQINTRLGSFLATNPNLYDVANWVDENAGLLAFTAYVLSFSLLCTLLLRITLRFYWRTRMFARFRIAAQLYLVIKSIQWEKDTRDQSSTYGRQAHSASLTNLYRTLRFSSNRIAVDLAVCAGRETAEASDEPWTRLSRVLRWYSNNVGSSEAQVLTIRSCLHALSRVYGEAKIDDPLKIDITDREETDTYREPKIKRSALWTTFVVPIAVGLIVLIPDKILDLFTQ